MAELRADAESAANPEQLWRTVTDWPGQSRWIPLTRTRLVAGPEGVGARLEGWTGVGPVGFLDTMVIDVWEPPHRLVVLHTGRVVRGTAGVDIVASGSGSRLTWWEDVEPPLGAVGRALWPVGAPVATAILRRCLRRAAFIAAEQPSQQ